MKPIASARFGLTLTFALVTGALYAASPVVTTLPATGVSNTVATLNGTVNPGGSATTAWFEWGLYPANNTNTTAPVAVGSGTSSVAVSNNLTVLTPGVIYHYRVMASNTLGVARGSDVMFRSPAITLTGGAVFTNECHSAFTDPGATVVVPPLAVAGGGFHTLALKGDGKVAAWGNNDYGETQRTSIRASVNSP